MWCKILCGAFLVSGRHPCWLLTFGFASRGKLWTQTSACLTLTFPTSSVHQTQHLSTLILNLSCRPPTNSYVLLIKPSFHLYTCCTPSTTHSDTSCLSSFTDTVFNNKWLLVQPFAFDVQLSPTQVFSCSRQFAASAGVTHFTAMFMSFSATSWKY